jgi:hypothetical protein
LQYAKRFVVEALIKTGKKIFMENALSFTTSFSANKSNFLKTIGYLELNIGTFEKREKNAKKNYSQNQLKTVLD